MTVFCDTSALAKRYVMETGSAWVEGLLAGSSGNDVVISRITPVELMSALARRERGGSISKTDADLARLRLRSDCLRDYLVVRLQDSHFALAESLATLHGLRAYDAMQLAVAVEVQRRFQPLDYTFISADDNLNRAAAAEGLKVDNPNRHP